MYILSLSQIVVAKNIHLQSPDARIEVNIDINDVLTYSVSYNKKQIILLSPISMTLEKYGQIGKNPELVNVHTDTADRVLYPVAPVKSKSIRDNYNETILDFKGSYSIAFRAYDDGIAYRFILDIDKKIKINREEVHYNFPKGLKIYFPSEPNLVSHYEAYYDYAELKDVNGKQCLLPVLLLKEDDVRMLITEADINDYPGLYLYGSNNSLIGRHPNRVLKYSTDEKGLVSTIIKRGDYIAETNGKRTYPWRVVVIAENDADLLMNELVYKLGREQEIKDTSWIKPGKVAWDWYNANNIYGVDFRAGINTNTYKYYIDFASQYNLQYVIFDEGWYVGRDVFKINPDMNVDELFKYAKQKNVGIILWVGWKAFDDKFEDAIRQFASWGAAGIKVDFMMRDDQDMVNYFEKIAKEAAKHHMLVDFHGSYKPDGMQRTYPNVLTREGLKGLENNKWDDRLTPEHCLTLPFIRMVVGPMDFTPGAMRNAQQEDFQKIFNCPMSQGTRCMQLAMYVIYESPLQMLADSPSTYMSEPEIMDYLSKVPTVWDETKIIKAKISDYIVLARRNGSEWYVAAMTDWTPRDFEIDLSFFKDGNYQLDIYQDGINADRYAEDYKHLKKDVTNKDTLKIKLAPAGGFVARFRKI
ncbi:MAG: hypothetical protein A2Y12_06910 [Planctomycetes bacterium GWF2_42_9]|nr:MAG: hypothetical protein A2Y12_06910 [Planctomycetes bacterium GWF2_42_9]